MDQNKLVEVCAAESCNIYARSALVASANANASPAP